MAKLLFPVQLQRQYGAPLDIDAVFATLDDMNAYLTSGRRYAGQLVTNLEQPGLIYILNNEMDGWIEFNPEQEPVLVETIADVTLTDLQTGQFLKYNGTAWINSDGVESINGFSGIVSLDTDDIPEGETNKYYPSADASKLAGIEEGAQVNTVDSVNGETGAVELDAADIDYDNSATTLTSTAVQGAIDELYFKKADVSNLSSNLILYPTTTESFVPQWYQLVTSPEDPDYNDTAVNIPTGTITAVDQLIATLVTEPGVLVGNPGIVNAITIGNIRKTSGNLNDFASFFFEIYKRSENGDLDYVTASSNTAAVNPEDLNVYQEFSADALINNGTFLSTDRLLVRFFAKLISGAPTYEIQFGGNNPVRILLPVPASVTIVNQDASSVPVDTSLFDGLLSNADDTVQKALETLDALTAGDLNALNGNDPRIENWDEAYSWGDHSLEGYLTSSSSLSAANITGTISSANLPPLALTDVHVVNSEAAMIALVAQEGDVAIRTDINKSFIHTGNDAGDVTDWTELLTPTDAVLSVNGETGTVTLGASDVGALDASDVRINDWDTAYAWGDHSQAGYLTDYTVTESDVTQHEAALSITKSQISDFSVDISDINTTGTPSATTFLNGDGEWLSITGAVESVNGQTGIVELTNADLLLEEVEVSANRVLQLSDSGKLLRFVNEEPAIVYIPDESVVDFPLATEIVVLLYSASSVSFEAVAGATINYIGESAELTQQFTSALLRKVASDEWLLVLPTVPVEAGASSLVDLTDTVIDSPAENQVLSYNGTEWVNSDLSITSSQVTDLNDYITSIDGIITDVDTSQLAEGHVLYYNGVNWSTANPTGTGTESQGPTGFNLYPQNTFINDMIESPENPGYGYLEIVYDPATEFSQGWINSWSTWTYLIQEGYTPIPAQIYIQADGSGADYFGVEIVSYDAENISLLFPPDVYDTIVNAGATLEAVWMNFVYEKPGTGLGLLKKNEVLDAIVETVGAFKWIDFLPTIPDNIIDGNNGDILTWDSNEMMWKPQPLPAIAITSTHVVENLTERDALEVEEGDVAIVTGESKSYIYKAVDGWIELLSPGDEGAVTSVNGEIGNVVLTASDLSTYDSSEIDTLLLGKVDVTTFNTHTHTLSDITDAPATFVESINGASGSITLAASDIGAAEASHTHTLSEITDYAPYAGIVTVASSKTLELTDTAKLLKVTNTATITIPADASLDFPIGAEIAIVNYGSGDVTIAAGAGVTINSKSGNNKLDGQYASAAIKKIAVNEWLLVGALISA